MKNKNKSLTTLLYVALFGCLIASVSASPAVGLIFATLLFIGIKTSTKAPANSFGAGDPEIEVKTAEEIQKDIAKKLAEYKAAVKEGSDNVNALRLEVDELRSEKKDAEIAALKSLVEQKNTEMNDILIKQGEELTLIKDASGSPIGVKGRNAELSEMIMKGIKANEEKLKEAIEKGGMIKFDIKAAGTMTITGNYSGGTVGLSSFEDGMTRIVRRKPFLRQLVNTAGTTSKYVVWIEQDNADPGTAGTIAEGGAKQQTDFDLVERSQEVRKIAVWIKVSKEMLADLPFIEGEIRTELMELVELKLDEQILSGDNVAPNMKGLTEYATAWSAGTFVDTVDNANRFDVLRTAIAQIEIANFSANYIILNPADVAAMELVKDPTTRQYVLPPFIGPNGNTIAGVPIVANNGVTAGEFLVGDFTKAQLKIREDINIQVGFVNDDFTKNLVTILAEMRACFYVKTNHVAAFSYGTFAAAIADLETP